jgi:hypothetical protein
LRLALAQPGVWEGSLGLPVAVAASASAKVVRATAKNAARIDPLLESRGDASVALP